MRTVASDLTHGEAVAIGEGSVELAVRASIAMPPVLTPVLVDGRTLVDGGIANPVPCNVVRDLGADVVIAVEVIPRLDADATTVLTRLSRGLNRINPLAYLSGRVDSQNVIDTIMNAFHLVEFELSTYQARNADIVVRPELPSHTGSSSTGHPSSSPAASPRAAIRCRRCAVCSPNASPPRAPSPDRPPPVTLAAFHAGSWTG